MRARFFVFVAATVVFQSALSNPSSAQVVSPDTLKQYAKTTPANADSLSLVAAAKDALQGMSSLEVPMIVEKYVREKTAVVIELRPAPDPKVVWLNRGGSVRILNDGRRVVVTRR